MSEHVGENQDRIIRCRHGEKVATRTASGSWLLHHPCWRCDFRKRFPLVWRLRSHG